MSPQPCPVWAPLKATSTGVQSTSVLSRALPGVSMGPPRPSSLLPELPLLWACGHLTLGAHCVVVLPCVWVWGLSHFFQPGWKVGLVRCTLTWPRATGHSDTGFSWKSELGSLSYDLENKSVYLMVMEDCVSIAPFSSL